MDMHSFFFSGEKEETITFLSEYCRTHLSPHYYNISYFFGIMYQIPILFPKKIIMERETGKFIVTYKTISSG